MPKMKPHPHWLRAGTSSKPSGVDREAKVIRSMVIAQAGEFKDSRGRFLADDIKEIVRLANAKPKGLRSNFTHETLSSDGLGKHLGRVRGAFLGTAVDGRTGKLVQAARGDLHFDETAFNTPSGDLATYIMDLAESDPDALSSSLVLEIREEVLRDEDDNVVLDDDTGEPVAPIWHPTVLHGSDIVSVGAAVDGLLSLGIDVDGLPDGVVRQGAEMLDRFFAGQSREVIEERCTAWLGRYLDAKFPKTVKVETPRLNAASLKLAEMALVVQRFAKRV